MGTEIKDIVVVNITRETARILRQGFGIPLILAPIKEFYDRVMTFADPDELLDAGFTTADAVYKMALAMYSQTLSPEQFKVGRKYEDVNAIQKIVFSATPDAGTFKIKVGAETTAAIAFDDVAADVKAALELLTGVTSVTVTGSISTTGLTIEFTGVDGLKHWALVEVEDNTLEISGDDVSAVPSVVQYGSAEETWSEAFVAVKEFDNTWYGLLTTSRTKADIIELAALVEAYDKLFGFESNDSDVITSATDDVFSSLKALNYDRTFGIWSENTGEYHDAAWMGLELPKDAGSSNWAFKSLSGVTPSDLSTTAIGYLKDKNANYFEEVGGVNIISSNAVVASGEYIDIIHGTDALHAGIGEDVFEVFIDNEKIPYTDDGITLIRTPLENKLLERSDRPYNLLVKSSIKINQPAASAVSSADKNARFLRNLTFSATYQGAINKVQIDGKLSV